MTFSILGDIVEKSSRKAPYHRPGSNLVPNSYIVKFHDNHTLQDHFDYLGQNLSETANRFRDMPGFGGYALEIDSYTLHEQIRYDPGVSRVTHNSRIKPNLPKAQDSIDNTYSNRTLNRRSTWFRTTVMNAGYGSAMISAPNKTDFSSQKGTYVSIISIISQ